VSIIRYKSFYVSIQNHHGKLFRLPEIPPDTEVTNPLLKNHDSNGILDLSSVTQSQAFHALGKLLLEYEAEVGRIEQMCIGLLIISKDKDLSKN